MTNADTFKLAILDTISFYFNSQPWIMCAIFHLYHLKTEGGVLETPFNQTTTSIVLLQIFLIDNSLYKI